MESYRRPSETDEDGFTLIELMVVVMIIAILLAIAIPTFLGARERAQDRAAQAMLRNALTAEKVFYTDNQAYTTDSGTGAIKAIEASLTYAAAAAPSVVGVIYIDTGTSSTPDDTLLLGAKSDSGKCFYLKDLASGAAYGSFAAGSCVTPSAATYVSKW